MMTGLLFCLSAADGGICWKSSLTSGDSVLVVHVCFVLFFQSPWGPPVLAPAPCSLADVMSEQLARQLHEEGSTFPEIPE